MRAIRAPLRGDEVWARWLEHARERGFLAGDPSDLTAAILGAGVWPRTLPNSPNTGSAVYYTPADVARVLDALELMARQRRPRFTVQVDREPRLSVTVTVDGHGLAGNYSEATAALRGVALEIRDEALAEDALTSGVSVARTARRWGVSPDTVQRAVKKCRKEAEPMRQGTRKSA